MVRKLAKKEKVSLRIRYNSTSDLTKDQVTGNGKYFI